MPAARTTEAKIHRAICAAKRAGCSTVEVLRDGTIRILVTAPTEAVASPEAAEDVCDNHFGTGK